MRISGLATGMDTESIIRDMMKAHRLPLEKVTQKKQYLQWQLDDYRALNRDLRTREYKLSDTVIRQATFAQKNVNVSDDKAVSIRSLSATSDFSGTIEVSQLAKQASLQGGTITKNGVKLTEEEFASAKLSDVFQDIQSVDGKISMTIQVGEGAAKTIEVSEGDSIGAVVAAINKDTDVNAFFDPFSGKIAMTAKNSGAGQITITDTTKDGAPGGNLGEKLRLTGAVEKNDGNKSSDIALYTEGQNARFIFNGLETERASNTFQINGFEVTLKQATTSPVIFSSSANTDKIVDAVVQFANDYNELIEKLNSQIREPKYRGFPPLSDEQKKEMKEKEIELWEEKAKSGTLRNDSTISSMLTSLRGIMSEQIEVGTNENGDPIKMSLKDLGIELSKSYSENGKLIINEDKLREKIAENPDHVYNLIGRDDKTNPDNSGIAQKYRQVLRDTQKSIGDKAGTTSAVNDTFALGRTMKSMDKEIERFQDKLKMIEDRYWRQFTAMERAIQRANAQSAQLMSSFGGGY